MPRTRRAGRMQANLSPTFLTNETGRNCAGPAPGRSQAGPHPLGGSADVFIGRGVVMSTVLLLHGAAKIGDSLAATIAAAEGLRLLASVTSVAEARAALERATPDLFIADLLQP